MTPSTPSERIALAVGWSVVLAIALALSAALRREVAGETMPMARPEPTQLATVVLPTEHADAYGDDVNPEDDTGR